MEIKDANTAREFEAAWRSRWERGNGITFLTSALDGLFVNRLHATNGSDRWADLCEAIGVLKVAHFKATGRAYLDPFRHLPGSRGSK